MEKCGQCRSEIRLHVLCSLILIYAVHKGLLYRQRSVQSDLDLRCPKRTLVSSTVGKELKAPLRNVRPLISFFSPLPCPHGDGYCLLQDFTRPCFSILAPTLETFLCGPPFRKDLDLRHTNDTRTAINS